MRGSLAAEIAAEANCARPSSASRLIVSRIIIDPIAPVAMGRHEDRPVSSLISVVLLPRFPFFVLSKIAPIRRSMVENCIDFASSRET
jgi:hypothetical protein